MIPYPWLLTLHVVAATVLVGGSLVATPLVRTALGSATSPAQLRDLLRLGRPLGTVNPVASLLVLATGVGLSSLLGAWRAPWVQVALGIWLVNAVTARRFVAPHMARLAAAAARESSDGIGPELDALRRSGRARRAGALLLANDVATLLLMTLKPGWILSLTLVGTIHLASTVAGPGRLRGPGPRGRRPAAAAAPGA